MATLKPCVLVLIPLGSPCSLPYAFPTVTTRYVRITGYGQWSGPTRLSL